MVYFRLYDKESDHSSEAGHPQNTPMVCYAIDKDIVHFHDAPVSSITVQGLIDAGYATVDTGGRIQILSTCPYSMNLITDFLEVLTNNKQLINPSTSTAFGNNSFVWDVALPAGWTAQDIVNTYTNNPLNFGMGTLSGDYNATPRFYGIDFTGINSMTITMKGGSWNVIGRGIFNEGRNTTGGTIENCPETINFVLTESYSSVAQVAFTQMKGTKNFNFSCPYFGCHDVSGLFEYSSDLQNLTFPSGVFAWNEARNVTNMFHLCNSIKEIPLGNSSQSRDAGNNVLFARRDAYRGTSSYDQTFMNCQELVSIKPTMNWNAVLPSYCTANGGTFTNCNKLSDIRIMNLNNGNWDFVNEAKTALPAIDVDSINYLLNNVATNVSLEYGVNAGWTIACDTGKSVWDYDHGNAVYYTDSTKSAYTVTATSYPVTVADLGGFSITLPAAHQSEVDSSAISSAQSKGWTVNFA